MALAFALIHLIAITPLKADAVSDVSDYVVRKYIQEGVTYVDVEYDFVGGPPEGVTLVTYVKDYNGLTEYFNTDSVEMIVDPIGPNYVSYYAYTFDFSDIPDGAILNLEYDFNVRGVHPWYDLTADFAVVYLNEERDELGIQSCPDIDVITYPDNGVDWHTSTFSMELNKTTDFCRFVYSVRGFRDGEAGESDFQIYCNFRSISLSFSYDSLVDLADGQDKTNHLLELLQSGSQNMHDNANAADKEMSNSSDRLGSLGDTLSGVNKPDLDSSAGNIDNFLAGGFGPAASVLTVVTENKTIGTMLMLVGTLALVSYVFFGKRR